MLHLDGYTDLEQIGQGGLGDVYRATRTSTNRRVAIKVLRDVSDESVAWHRARRELTALVSLGGHAHVVQVVEVLEHTPGMVMEYAPGGSVAQLVDRRGTTLEPGEIVLIGRQTAAALAAAHQQGIVHRDVKPQNLLIDAYGQIKLCDFGIASLARTEEFRTRTSAISMRYASPEDLDEDAAVGPPADVYSLGATLLHLTHGAPPTLKERLAPWVPPPGADATRAALDEIIAACLHPDPARRPTAHQVHDSLEQLEWRLHDRRRALDVPVDSDGLQPHVDQSSADTASRVPSGDASGEFEPLDAPADATLYRTGRAPLPPERPEPPRRRRGAWPTAIAAVTVVAAVSVVAVLVRSDDANAPSSAGESSGGSAPAPSVLDRPVELSPIDGPDVIWPIGPVGECLVQVDDAELLQPIDCELPHDLQRFAAGALDADLDSPTDAELEVEVAERCLGAAPALSLPEMQIAQTNPTAATWSDGDRQYQCLVGVPGARLAGTALD